MNKLFKFICICLIVLMQGCKSTETTDNNNTDTEPKQEETMMEKEMKMRIGETEVQVVWEENESVQALKELVKDKSLSIQMSMYGGFEQVGSIGTSLPRNDRQTTTNSGDIVLYSGNQVVVFYGSNSWAYTRLGHITNKNQNDMRDLLSNGDVTITFYVGE